MLIDLSGFLEALSVSVDYVEREFFQVNPRHASRVAALSVRMGQEAGLSQEVQFALLEGALLHDCALTEYLSDEQRVSDLPLDELDMASHCTRGEAILLQLPGYRAAAGAVLFHHERADGTGAFRRRAEDTPLAARIIHCADAADVAFSLNEPSPEKYGAIGKWLTDSTGSVIDAECAELFRRGVTPEVLADLAEISAAQVLPAQRMTELSCADLIDLSGVFAYITDYKSAFTRRHSLGIADKAREMGRFYGYDGETCDALYIAGALHDVGKIMITNDILEKPGRLTAEEYQTMQHHAMGTHLLLDNIRGLETIASWASNHHEKLDGTGYPFGKKADDLGKNERLLACIDIYQALVEPRPYKDGFPHEKAMEILREMGEKGQLDRTIIEDIDRCFRET